MKSKEKQTTANDKQSTAEYLRQLLEQIGDKDLFPRKTANARKFLEKLHESRQNLIQ